MTRKPSLLPAVITIATLGVAAGAALLARKRKEELKDFVISQVIEKPAGRSSFTDLAQSLERGAHYLMARTAKAPDSEHNRELLAHIIGIERWGQSRLEVALEKRPLVMDEYHPYRPSTNLSINALAKELAQTRTRTIELAQELHHRPPHDDFVVEHNGLGPLTAKGWLRYLTQHADLESRKLRSEDEEQDSATETSVEASTLITTRSEATM